MNDTIKVKINANSGQDAVDNVLTTLNSEVGPGNYAATPVKDGKGKPAYVFVNLPPTASTNARAKIDANKGVAVASLYPSECSENFESQGANGAEITQMCDGDLILRPDSRSFAKGTAKVTTSGPLSGTKSMLLEYDPAGHTIWDFLGTSRSGIRLEKFWYNTQFSRINRLAWGVTVKRGADTNPGGRIYYEELLRGPAIQGNGIYSGAATTIYARDTGVATLEAPTDWHCGSTATAARNGRSLTTGIANTEEIKYLFDLDGPNGTMDIYVNDALYFTAINNTGPYSLEVSSLLWSYVLYNVFPLGNGVLGPNVPWIVDDFVFQIRDAEEF